MKRKKEKKKKKRVYFKKEINFSGTKISQTNKKLFKG